MAFAGAPHTDDALSRQAIDGDPFTDSQEYPTRFAVNAAVIRGATATVSVVFNDSAQRKTVVYVLTRIEGRWLVDDLRYGGALTVRRLLSGAP